MKEQIQTKNNKKTLFITFILIFVIMLIVLGFFAWRYYLAKTRQKTASQTQTQTQSQSLKLDPKKEATHLSKVAGAENAYWMRGHPFIWNDIEKEKGEFDWTITDERLIGLKDKENYFGVNQGEEYHLAMIWPYANWDQDACHQDPKYLATGHLKESKEDLKIGAPCDIEAYSNFLKKVVERYDGDGIDDMPGLKTPINYWEIMNEPEMQGGSIGGAGEDLKFFVGTPEEYLEILKASYETIKKADPEAKVAHAGMAGVPSMDKKFQNFWNPVFEAGGGNYSDIANIHAISVDNRKEDLGVIEFKKYLEKYGIKDKPIWFTEVQFGELMGKPADLPSFENLLVKASVISLANGAQKLFYIENWLMWDNEEAFGPPKDDKDKEKDKKFAPKDSDIEIDEEFAPKEKDAKKDEKFPPKPDTANNSTHKVYLNLIDKINQFDKIETIKQEFEESQVEFRDEFRENFKDDFREATFRIGQYKFLNGDNAVYILWGNAEPPAEIAGRVKVTNIYGESKEENAESITLSDQPIFVELLR